MVVHLRQSPGIDAGRCVNTVAMAIRPVFLEALSLILPSSCRGCGAEDRVVCEECRQALIPQVRTAELWHEGAVPLPLVYGLDYAEPVSGILHALKERGTTAAAAPLGVALREVLRAALPILFAQTAQPRPARVLVTFPPSTPANYQLRGYVPLVVLLRAARVQSTSLLTHTAGRRNRADQSTLHRSERFNNLTGTLRATRNLDGETIVLVDDVATSGATLLECARAVRAAGGEVLGAVTIAHTPRKFSAHSQVNA